MPKIVTTLIQTKSLKNNDTIYDRLSDFSVTFPIWAHKSGRFSITSVLRAAGNPLYRKKEGNDAILVDFTLSDEISFTDIPDIIKNHSKMKNFTVWLYGYSVHSEQDFETEDRLGTYMYFSDPKTSVKFDCQENADTDRAGDKLPDKKLFQPLLTILNSTCKDVAINHSNQEVENTLAKLN